MNHQNNPTKACSVAPLIAWPPFGTRSAEARPIVRPQRPVPARPKRAPSFGRIVKSFSGSAPQRPVPARPKRAPSFGRSVQYLLGRSAPHSSAAPRRIVQYPIGRSASHLSAAASNRSAAPCRIVQFRSAEARPIVRPQYVASFSGSVSHQSVTTRPQRAPSFDRSVQSFGGSTSHRLATAGRLVQSFDRSASHRSVPVRSFVLLF